MLRPSILSTPAKLILRLPHEQTRLSSFLVGVSFTQNFSVSSKGTSRNIRTAAFLHSSNSDSSSVGTSPAPPTTPASQQVDWKKLTNEEWAKRLSPEAYNSTREGGTEPPFSGQYVNHKAEGVYKCVCCGSELFTSKAKFDSGSGWPSFFAAVDDNAITKRKDVSHGMVRTEILCSTCNAHLGHVFDDGPKPTGQRFCVNSVALKFNAKKLS